MNEPVCYKCKEKGHMVAECQKGKTSRKLKMFGFGIPNMGFYSMDIPEAKAKSHKAVVIISIMEGETNCKKLEEELNNLIDTKWDWQVKELGNLDFSAIFPKQQDMETFAKVPELVLPLYGLKVKIRKSDLDPEASAVLQEVWIKIYGLPSMAKEEDIVKEVASLVCEPMVVDELSMVRADPVRVKGKCRDPSQLRGFIEIFFNSVGYEIRFVVEGFQGKKEDKGGGPPGPKHHKRRKHHEKDDDSDEDEEDSEGRGYGTQESRQGTIQVDN
ncbi:hypothetical protein QOZ80_5BG0445870 [Eleusine coracana subsp. coracana]|nr:hypothetical protein QOZ80_5BG0445870 [Eleusine coracana subsp. coracana]